MFIGTDSSNLLPVNTAFFTNEVTNVCHHHGLRKREMLLCFPLKGDVAALSWIKVANSFPILCVLWTPELWMLCVCPFQTPALWPLCLCLCSRPGSIAAQQTPAFPVPEQLSYCCSYARHEENISRAQQAKHDLFSEGNFVFVSFSEKKVKHSPSSRRWTPLHNYYPFTRVPEFSSVPSQLGRMRF